MGDQFAPRILPDGRARTSVEALAIAEQDRRSAEEALIRNGYYESILASAVASADACMLRHPWPGG